MPKAQRDLSASYSMLGDLMLRLGQTDAAPKYCRDCLAIAKKLADANPRDGRGHSRDLSVSYEKCGDTGAIQFGQTDACAEVLSGQSGDPQEPCDADPSNTQRKTTLGA